MEHDQEGLLNEAVIQNLNKSWSECSISSVTLVDTASEPPASPGSASFKRPSASKARISGAKRRNAESSSGETRLYHCSYDGCAVTYKQKISMRNHERSHNLDDAKVALPADSEIMDQVMVVAPGVLTGFEEVREGQFLVNHHTHSKLAAALGKEVSESRESGIVFLVAISLCICEAVRQRQCWNDSRFLETEGTAKFNKQMSDPAIRTNLLSSLHSICVSHSITNVPDRLLHNFAFKFASQLNDAIVSWITSLLTKEVMKDIPSSSRAGPDLFPFSEPSTNAMCYVEGSIIKSAKRSRSSKPHVDPSVFTGGAQLANAISDFTTAQNRGGLEIPNHAYYKFAHGILRHVSWVVYRNLGDSLSHETVLTQLEKKPEVKRLWHDMIKSDPEYTTLDSDASVNSFEFTVRKLFDTFMRGVINKIRNREHPKGTTALCFRSKIAS